MLEAALLCLSLNLFHEARGESVPGQYAVAQVTMKRAGDDPAKVCKTVYRRKQFSWTHQKVGKRNPMKVDPDAWRRAQIIAATVLLGRMQHDFTGGATHYHATRVNPYWAKSKVSTVTLGRHIFYL